MKREEDLVQWLRTRTPPLPDLQVGIGDDAAVLNVPPGEQLVISTDCLVQDVHFLADRVSPRILGRRAMRVNLSDLAAMAAKPLFSLLSLAIPQDRRDDPFLTGLLEGVLEEAACWEAPLVGGNISKGGELQVSVTVGGTVPRGEAILRSGCLPGDGVYALGLLGHSGAGLRMLLQRQPRLPLPQNEAEIELWSGDSWSALCMRAHLLPEPQLEAAGWLRGQGLAHSMIDSSDGLARDLLRLCEASGVDLVIDGPALELLRRQADEKIKVVDILEGGEDYALLFSCPPEREASLRNLPPEMGRPLRVASARTSTEDSLFVEWATGSEQPYIPNGFDHLQ